VLDVVSDLEEAALSFVTSEEESAAESAFSLSGVVSATESSLLDCVSAFAADSYAGSVSITGNFEAGTSAYRPIKRIGASP